MQAQFSDFFSSTINKEKDISTNFRDNLSKYVYHWPLFVISFIVIFSGAFFYLQTTKPSYLVKATLLIKDLMKAPEEKQPALNELDISNPPKLSESEIEVLKSRKLIDRVVKDLHLWIIYQKEDGLENEDLYKRSPIIFRQLGSRSNIYDKEIFNIIVKDNKSFYLKESNGEIKEFFYKNILMNNFGLWKLEPTTNLQEFKRSEIKIIINNPNIVAEGYQKNIKVELLNKLAPAIGLSLKDNVQQRGKDILNDLINNYNLNSIEEKNRITQSTLDFINKRIGSISDELGGSENDLQNYRSKNQLTNISSQSAVYLENVQSNDKELNKVNVQLNIIEGIDHYINSTQNTKSIPATLDIDDPSLNNSIEKLSELLLQRDKLLANTPENNPLFTPINLQIKTTKAAIREIIQNIKLSLLAAKNKLQSFNAKFESSIRNIPEQDRNLIDKTRQQTIKENLYTYLLQKREEASLKYASTLDDVQIVDNAYISNLKTDRVLYTYCFAFLLSFLLPTGFIYGRNSFNNRITTSKEIELGTDNPLFGELSYAKGSSSLIDFDKGNIKIGEEFRDLRTNLHFLKENKEKDWVTLVTSSIASEGKSFVSCNLGYVLAVSGRKTIILEMDMRKPKVSHIFGLSKLHVGISDYLNNQSSIEEIIQKSDLHPNLDVIGSGPLPSDPSELLERKDKIDYLFDWLRSKYDDIIIDTPPINLVTDAKILFSVSNVALYIIRQAHTYKSLLPFIKSLIKKGQSIKVKIIFNAVENGRYGYGHNYGKGYYNVMGRGKKRMIGLGISDFLKRF